MDFPGGRRAELPQELNRDKMKDTYSGGGKTPSFTKESQAKVSLGGIRQRSPLAANHYYAGRVL